MNSSHRSAELVLLFAGFAVLALLSAIVLFGTADSRSERPSGDQGLIVKAGTGRDDVGRVEQLTSGVTVKRFDVHPAPSDPGSVDEGRGTLSNVFRDLDALPFGFEMDHVRLTPDGFELEPAEDGGSPRPRVGTITSAVRMLSFGADVLTPMWKGMLGGDTKVRMELSLSHDGHRFGPWLEIKDDDGGQDAINKFLHDGRLNPNFGYTPGETLSLDGDRWRYFKYRLVLEASPETDDSPLVSAFRMYYQDSAADTRDHPSFDAATR